ncbi:MAG: arabinan endo-1,5-alpha-L-arabinosidase [Bacteroides sp.]|nr:arabinan endo-1,5-alpha-L-arabinosidase [Bacteroides sp.]
MKRYIWLTMLLSCVFFFGACNDDDVDYGTSGVVLNAPTTTAIGGVSATLSTTFAKLDEVRYTNAGYCYSTESGPTIYNATVNGTIANDSITATLTGLLTQKTYYVRAFMVIYEGETVYSDEITFTTTEGTLEEELASYEPPTYDDNYSSIADWSYRSQWNLANVHDPSVVLAEDGYYYMYQTDASYGNAHEAGGHFHGRRSQDLVNWEYLGGTMQSLPSWVMTKLNEIRTGMGLPASTAEEADFGYWAPCVRKVKDGLYRMYYSIVVPGYLDSTTESWGERAFIGLMENSDPSNNDGWEDKGYVITNASDKGLDFYVSPTDYENCYYKWNAIDPSYIITESGQHWLIYGSWHSGIVAVELNADTGMPATTLGNPWADGEVPAEYGQLIATREAGNRWQGSEGPEIIYRDGYYYLFLAYDALAVPYNTRVVRSTSLTGPYVGIDGTDVTSGGSALPVVTHPYKFADSDGWVGISHCAVFDDGNDNWYFASQGRLPESVDNAIMMGHVRSIRWTSDGWPLVMPERYGAVPQVPITEEELVGNWEHIDLSYSYGTQKESATMTLAEDHTITAGTWEGGTWSYDADNQILTANGVELYLQREVDWEASPRTTTIVYAGYGSNYKTYWGKKSN